MHFVGRFVHFFEAIFYGVAHRRGCVWHSFTDEKVMQSSLPPNAFLRTFRCFNVRKRVLSRLPVSTTQLYKSCLRTLFLLVPISDFIFAVTANVWIKQIKPKGQIILLASMRNVFDISKKSERTSYREVVRIFHVWWRLGDSNPRPHACEACALTS